MRFFNKTASAVFVVCVLLLSGCSALRPLTEPNKPTHGRHTLGVDSVNWVKCAGMNNIGFSTSYKALEVPHGVIMGQVQIHNRGFEPFEFRTPGFRLTGSGGYMDSAMKCPDNQVPAGGVMQCGFAAPALDAVKFDSFQPFFVTPTSALPCFCNKPYSIEPFSDPFFEESPAKSFADAMGEAFGGPAFHQTLDKLDSWKGNPLALAEDIVDSIFGAIANTPFQFSAQLGDSSLEIFTGPPARRTPPSSTEGPSAQTKPAEPVPTKADAPITPMKPAEPVPSKADAPITPAKPAEPVPTEAAAPSIQTKPAEPVPTSADAPTQTKPAEPVPSKADAPITPAKPAEPVPTEAAAPTTQTKPAEPVPAKADVPITQTKPAEPVPAKADAPVTSKPANPVPTKADAPITQTKPAEPVPSKADAPITQTKPAEPVPTKADAPTPILNTNLGSKAPATTAPVADSAAGKAPSEQQAAPVANKPTTALPSTPAPAAKGPAAVKADAASGAAPKQVPKTDAPADKPAAATDPQQVNGPAAAGPQKAL